MKLLIYVVQENYLARIMFSSMYSLELKPSHFEKTSWNLTLEVTHKKKGCGQLSYIKGEESSWKCFWDSHILLQIV